MQLALTIHNFKLYWFHLIYSILRHRKRFSIENLQNNEGWQTEEISFD